MEKIAWQKGGIFKVTEQTKAGEVHGSPGSVLLTLTKEWLWRVRARS